MRFIVNAEKKCGRFFDSFSSAGQCGGQADGPIHVLVEPESGVVELMRIGITQRINAGFAARLCPLAVEFW